MSRPRPVLAVCLLLVALAGCSKDSSSPPTTSVASKPAVTAKGRRTTTTVASTTSAPTTSAPTTSTPGALSVGDYEGQQFDGGFVKGVTRTGDVVQISFDRYQVYVAQPDGQYALKSGTELTEEPILYGNSDVPYVNDNPKLRTFTLAPDVTILRLADPVPCGADDRPTDPVWQSITVAALEGGAWTDRQEDSLVFNPAGLVRQVRLSSGC